MFSSLIVEPMENWLQLMLNWDPQQRGGPVDLTLKQPRCFVLMDHILNLKVSLNGVYFIRLTLKLTNLLENGHKHILIVHFYFFSKLSQFYFSVVLLITPLKYLLDFPPLIGTISPHSFRSNHIGFGLVRKVPTWLFASILTFHPTVCTA